MKLFGVLVFAICLAAAGGLAVASMGCGDGFSSTDYCAPGCQWLHTWNEVCDNACNNEACNYDNGRCDTESFVGCSTDCPYYWVGDGECDSACNNYACSYDGGDCAIPVKPTQSTGIVRNYAWSYDGTEWTWTLTIPGALYEYYKGLDRPTCNWGDCDYSVLVTDSGDDYYIESLVNALKDGAEEYGYDEWETINYAVSFVQSLPYTYDNVSTGFDNYARYPVETLIDNGGDCEDTSILMAAIIDEMGYGIILLYYEGLHVAVGVLGGEGMTGTYFSHNRGKYYYLETAGDNSWELGQMPPQFHGMEAYVYDIN